MSVEHDAKNTTENATLNVDNESETNVTSESTPNAARTNEESANANPSVNSAIKCVQSKSSDNLHKESAEINSGVLNWVLHESGGCEVSWSFPEGSTTPKDYIALCCTGESTTSKAV